MSKYLKMFSCLVLKLENLILKKESLQYKPSCYREHVNILATLWSCAGFRPWRHFFNKVQIMYMKRINPYPVYIFHILLYIFRCTSDLIFSWKQTLWTLNRLHLGAVWSGSKLLTISATWQEQWQKLWQAGKRLQI